MHEPARDERVIHGGADVDQRVGQRPVEVEDERVEAHADLRLSNTASRTSFCSTVAWS